MDEPLITKQKDNDMIDENLRSKIINKRAALTDVEAAFLHALLIDPMPSDKVETNDNPDETIQLIKTATRMLDDDILFSIPTPLLEKDERKDVEQVVQSPKKRPTMTKEPKDYRFLVGLWQAFEEGVTSKKLNQLRKSRIAVDDGLEKQEDDQEPQEEEDSVDGDSVHSDVEVRGDNADDDSSDGSWGEDDCGFDHFDAWQVLKDEYAGDFGFDYSLEQRAPSMDDDELENLGFNILGTSADDTSAHPHVMSPPLMDAVITFIPDHLQGQNLWLKYSLLRDGASLHTFKQYARASKDTILAIETTKGHVFGSFTSTPWRTNSSFFGGSSSFVWKMRHNRHTPCHSLFEQAEMESEIDVFFLLEEGQKPQCCTSDILGLGGGKLKEYDLNGHVIGMDNDNEEYGFAIALQDDLLSGTTSKCHTYKNPCLADVSSNIETFEVLNLELWTFTPCFTLDSAEKLEMSQFFMSESIRHASMNSGSMNSDTLRIDSGDIMFGSRDFDQHEFYRRIGHGDANEELRERWQYRSMMDG
jgi:hypothetical protein